MNISSFYRSYSLINFVFTFCKPSFFVNNFIILSKIRIICGAVLKILICNSRIIHPNCLVGIILILQAICLFRIRVGSNGLFILIKLIGISINLLHQSIVSQNKLIKFIFICKSINCCIHCCNLSIKRRVYGLV